MPRDSEPIQSHVLITFEMGPDGRPVDEIVNRVGEVVTEMGGQAVRVVVRGGSEMERSRMLGMESGEMLSGLALATRRRALDEMKIQGISTVRDLLVVGSSRLRGIPGAGQETMDTIEYNLGALSLGIPFLRALRSDEIAAFCADLDEVLIQALFNPGMLLHRRLALQEGVRDSPLTVISALNNVPRFRRVMGTSENADRMHIRARAFKFAFDTARDQLGNP